MKQYFFFVLFFLTFFSCSKNETGNENNIKVPDQSFIESFDTASAATKKGWVFINKSIDQGTTNWSNPPTPPFYAFASENGPAGYIWADYNSTSSAAGIISNWAVSPILTMQNGDKISFYTRSELYY
ncbi:MAG: choice-of-anchor J domain-containing protein, partial [Chitinophagaceae bacterium]